METGRCTDDELLQLLRVELGPLLAPPPPVLAAANAAYRWRRWDEELAELLADSADDPVRGGMRDGSGGPRLVSYVYADLTVDCEVDGDTMLGHVLSSCEWTLEITNSSGECRSVKVNEYGQFEVAPLPAGPVRLRCDRPARPPVVTPWLLP